MKAQKAHWPPCPFSASLQLEVLTNLASETNIPTVLREFQVRVRAQLPREGPKELPCSSLCSVTIVLMGHPSLKSRKQRNGCLRPPPRVFCWLWARKSLHDG